MTTVFDPWPTTVYANSPPWLQSLAVTALGVLIRWQRRGGEFAALLAEAERSKFATPEECRAIRERLWDTRMRAAVAEVEAYGHRILSLDDVATLPILTKADVRDRNESFVRRSCPARQRVRMHTSGSTGAGLQFPMTLFALRRNYAHVWRFWGSHGIRPGEWCAVFGGRPVVAAGRKAPPFWITNYAGRSVHFSQYHLTPERARLYIEEIRARRLRWIHGYPSVIGLLAHHGIDLGLAGRTDVRWVTLASENVLDSHRRAIAGMFGVTPRQHYCMAESVAFISECPEGTLHVDEDHALVEFVPVPSRPGVFRLVGTSLDNVAFPLLRYEVGDLFQLREHGRCSCGRSGRMVRSIDGRVEDLLVLSDGSRVGRAGFFKDAVHVAEAQIVQQCAGEAILRVVRGAGYCEADEQALRAEIQQKVGERLAVRFDYVDELPRTSRGKLRLVVSALDDARRETVGSEGA